jgi:hypothetical protein
MLRVLLKWKCVFGVDDVVCVCVCLSLEVEIAMIVGGMVFFSTKNAGAFVFPKDTRHGGTVVLARASP